MDIIRLFKASSGLNTKVDPVRISYNAEAGVSDLSRAINVTHDDTGRVSSRSGYSLIDAGVYHSLFCDGGVCLVCKGQNMYQIGSDLSLSGVRGSMTGTKVSYCQKGHLTYYSNGFENGFIEGGVSYPWPTDTYAGPETSRVFSPAPVGNHIAFYKGRWYIVKDKVVWISEPYSDGLFDMSKNFIQFHSNVLMIKPVEEGIFISDEQFIWFFKGTNPDKFTQEKKTTYPAIEWSEAIDYIEGYEIGLENPGLCALWATTKGAMLGTSSGQTINLTNNKIVYPEIGMQGASLLKNNHFIHNIFF